MARQPSQTPPKYGLHKASGQAVVYLWGKPHYLGKHGSPESHEAYARILAEHFTAYPVKPIELGRQITVNQLLLAYFEFAKTYFVDPDGNQTTEYQQLLYAAKPLRKLYGRTQIKEFGPKRLKNVF